MYPNIDSDIDTSDDDDDDEGEREWEDGEADAPRTAAPTVAPTTSSIVTATATPTTPDPNCRCLRCRSWTEDRQRAELALERVKNIFITLWDGLSDFVHSIGIPDLSTIQACLDACKFALIMALCLMSIWNPDMTEAKLSNLAKVPVLKAHHTTTVTSYTPLSILVWSTATVTVTTATPTVIITDATIYSTTTATEAHTVTAKNFEQAWNDREGKLQKTGEQRSTLQEWSVRLLRKRGWLEDASGFENEQTGNITEATLRV